MKKIIRKIKNWLMGKLGGYTKEDMNIWHKAQVELRRLLLQVWADTVQEICRRSENSYYDWYCEYCSENCNKRNDWCEKFTPKIVTKESEDDNEWE